MSILGSLVGAVGSVLGGALGGNTSTKTSEKTRTKTRSHTRSRSNLSMMVRDAKRNGFNPLTILRAGGLGAYSQTSSRGVTTSKSKGRNVQSSSGPLGAGIAGAAVSVGNALTDTFTPQAATAADAWAGQPTEFVPTPEQDYANVMRQLAGSNWEGASLGGVPQLPASNEYLQKTPALANNKDSKDEVGPDGLLANQIKPKYEAAEWRQFLPKNMVDKYGLTVPTNDLINLEAGEGVFGDDLGAAPAAGYNLYKMGMHNKFAINRMIAQESAEGAQDYWSRLSGAADVLKNAAHKSDFASQVRANNPWAPDVNDDMTEMQVSTDRAKVIFGDPALMDYSGRRQFMELQTGTSW